MPDMTMNEQGWYPPRDMSKSELYRIKTLAGIDVRKEQESSGHASEPSLTHTRQTSQASAPRPDMYHGYETDLTNAAGCLK